VLRSMLFTSLVWVAVCTSFGMRPGTKHYTAASWSRLGEVVASAAHSKGSKSLESLKTAASIVKSIMLQQGNATEHMSEDDKILLDSVIDMIGKSIYGSMDSSHQTDVAAVQAALDAVSQCNSDIAARLGGGGDLNKLYLGVVGYQNGLNDLQGDVDAKTEVNNTKMVELQRHINNIGNSPDCADFPDSPTKLKADNFFTGSEYVDWYTSRQGAYAPFAEAFETADANLEDALAAYAVGLAERNVAYCDWKLELEGGCETFDQCYKDKVHYYNNEMKPALQQDMNVRIDAYKAGQTIIAQIQFLLGESTESVPPTDIDTSRFQVNFLPVPAKGECSLSPLDSVDWVPLPECSDEAARAPKVCTSFANVTSHKKVDKSWWAGKCPNIPDGASMIRVDMGDVIDYFKPVVGVTLCDMLQSFNKHLWSPDGDAWRAPSYYTHNQGGSAVDWPKNNGESGDQRRHLTFWGLDDSNQRKKNAQFGGCCHTTLTDGASWMRAFSMYTCS